MPHAKPGTPPAEPAPSIWDFGRPGAPILVRNAEAVLSHLAVFLDGWPLRRAGNDTATETDLAVETRSDGSFAVISHAPGGGEMLFETDFDAANGLAGALVGALITQDRERVCLHAGSAQIGGRGDGLAVFVGDSLAGKSSLALHLTVAGYRLFGDDRLEIRLSETADPVAICLGLMPKVRLPLPDQFGRRFAEFVDARSEVQFGDVAYLKPGSGEAACFGEAAPVAALVVLERGGGAPAALEQERRERTLQQLIETLLTIVDRRDPHAADHSARVAVVARDIALEMGLDEHQAACAETAGRLMNLGKILVRSELLSRAGTLDAGEVDKVRESIQMSAELLSGIEFEGPVVETLHQIQERWDGSGRPMGLKGQESLVTARVVAVANAFVAMTSPRAYRSGASADAATDQLMSQIGTAFERRVVVALVNLLDSRGVSAQWANPDRPAPIH